MTVKELTLYGEKAKVYEFPVEDIEFFQVKMFHYQNISGVRRFRFSMNKHTGYLYMDELDSVSEKVSLETFIEEGVSLGEMNRVLEQIRLIISESIGYLLYTENFLPDMQSIYISRQEDRLSGELLYLPVKRGTDIAYKEKLIQFMTRLTRFFSEKDDMDGFYFFARVLDDLTHGNLKEDNGRLDQILQMYLKIVDSRKHKQSMII